MGRGPSLSLGRVTRDTAPTQRMLGKTLESRIVGLITIERIHWIAALALCNVRTISMFQSASCSIKCLPVPPIRSVDSLWSSVL